MSLMRILLTASLVMLVGAMAACGPPPPPEPPTEIKVADTDDGKIVFTFQIEEQRKDRVAKIYVYRDRSEGGDFKDEVGTFSLSEGTLDQQARVYNFTFRDTNVLPNDEYQIPFFYKFVAESPQGEKGPASTVFKAASENVDEPAAVADQEVQGENNSSGPQITISWTPNKEFDVKGYYIFRKDKNEAIIPTRPEDAISQLIPHDGNAKRQSWVDKTIQEGKQYWYVVAAFDKGKVPGDFKPGIRFPGLVLAKASLVAPSDGASSAKPTFKWEAVGSASGYAVVLLDDAVGGAIVWRSDYTTTTEISYPDDAPFLAAGKTYYWFVYAFSEKPTASDAKGNSRSEVFSFTKN